jgi:DNA modification methylase
MKKLIWHTEQRKVNALLPYLKNPRAISDRQMKDLQKSLKKFNLVELPATDVDGKIVAGHQRVRALQILGRGDEIIEVRVPNRKLTQEEYDRYLITSNAVGGDWDFEKLKSFDLDLLTDIGFSKDELSNIWDEHLEVEGDDFDEEAELAKIKVPKTKLGDLILLGNHKLLCGDSTDPAVLKRLLGDEQAAVIYSDPVYNLKGGVSYSKGVGGKANYGGNVNDNRSDDEYKEFIKKSLVAALAVTKADAHIFYWSDQTYIWLIQQLYRELGIENKRVCLWLKNGQNPTPRVAFSKCYEPCTYGVRGKPFIAKNIQNLNEVMNKEITTGNSLLEETLDHLDVWLVKRLSGKDYEHATSKPPKLHEKAIRRCTRPGEIILDSFSGSGSTMIAAEQLKRRVYAVELEPIFCDLAITRYERLTGKKVKVIKQHEK